MVTISKIISKFGGNICRRCINETFNSTLLSEDCLYEMYPSKCSCCGEMRNIVSGFRSSGKIKLLFK